MKVVVVGARHNGLVCACIAWGLAVVWVRDGRPDLDTAGVYMAAVGLGAIAGLALARRGVAVEALGLAGTIVFAGLSLAFSTQWDELLEARSYAIAVGLVGLFNVVVGAVSMGRRGDPAAAARRAPGG